MNDVYEIELTKEAQRDLREVPAYIAAKFFLWTKLVKQVGLRESRKTKGFHDEPLKGNRRGQRSIKLNDAYRAIYVEKENNMIEFVEVQQVNKHDYRKKN